MDWTHHWEAAQEAASPNFGFCPDCGEVHEIIAKRVDEPSPYCKKPDEPKGEPTWPMK